MAMTPKRPRDPNQPGKGEKRKVIIGEPERKQISTSCAERSNLTMRTHMRRFTRLTNAFSKKVENHAAAIALHTFYYNFVRIHQTLKVTPAMAAGVTDKLWEMDDLVEVIEQWELANKQPRIQLHCPQVRYRKGLFGKCSVARRGSRFDLRF
jgi:hypothetical protein